MPQGDATVLRAESEILIQLSADQRVVLSEKLGKAQLLCKHVSERITHKTLSEGLAATALNLLEYTTADLSKATGVPCQTAAEVEQRFAELRQANTRIHELERQIGRAAAHGDIKQGVTVLSRQLADWWKLRGFGHVAEFSIGQWGGARVMFSGHLYPPGGTFSETPVTDQQNEATWLADLQARGFELFFEGRHDRFVVDSPASRAALHLLIAEIPSAEILGIQACRNKKMGGFVLCDIEVLIHEPGDIMALCTPAGREGSNA